MRLTVSNFGGIEHKVFDLSATRKVTWGNGTGKTSLINAYVFALSGKPLGGFEARRVGTPDVILTTVTLDDFFGLDVRRTLDNNGTTHLYLNGEHTTQSEFAKMFDIPFIVACADVNVLTNPSLTSEQLRKLLCTVNVMNEEGRETLVRTQKLLKESKKNAEQYAVCNVTVPVATCEPLTRAEDIFAEKYRRASLIVGQPILEKCQYCGARVPLESIEEQKREQREAKEFVEHNFDEYTRILEKARNYDEERADINEKKRIIENAKAARDEVVRCETELERIETELRNLDVNALQGELPMGVEVVTERSTRGGKTSSACSLTFNGVPLKSVNRGRRISMCVEMLHKARAQKGLQDVPIMVDNAESVQGLERIPNTILFVVG